MKIALGECRFSICVVLGASLLAHTAFAQDMTRYMAATAPSSGFGSGPMMVSLLGSARMEAPIRGTETAVEPGAPVRDTTIAIPVNVAPQAVPADAPDTGALLARRSMAAPAEASTDVASAR